MRTPILLATAFLAGLALPPVEAAVVDEVPVPKTEKPTPAAQKITVYQLTAKGKG